MKKLIVDRSQKSVGSGAGKFGGPDRYVSVVSVPEGVKFSPATTPLNRERLARKGVTVEYVGEYYSKSTGPRSAFARVMADATARVLA